MKSRTNSGIDNRNDNRNDKRSNNRIVDTAQQRWVLMATCLSYVIVILDTSIVNLALERIGMDLAGGVSGLQWVLNAYTLTFASLLLTGGTLGDRLGARNVYIAGLACFMVASTLCACAPGLPMLIAARSLQGGGAALLVPASMTLISHTWTGSRERAAVFGLWAGLGGIAMASGPLLGGMLVGFTGWRSIFLANVPICMAAMVLALRVGRAAPFERAGAAARKFDFAGQAAGIAALGLLNVLVIDVPAYGWQPPLAVGALAAGVIFVVIETMCAQPMLPMNLFRQPLFAGGVFVSMVSAFTFYGLLFELSLLLQRQQGYTPMQAGLAFLPLTLPVPVGSLLSKRALGRFGAKCLVTGACLLSAAGFFGLAGVGAAAPYALLALPLPAIGLAASLITPATTATLMSAVEDRRAGIAAGVLNAARQVGAALGVAWCGTLLSASHAIARGMHMSAMAAGALSIAAAVVWWHGAAERAPARQSMGPRVND
ncbi:MFS transporter [Paraburkholderia oxyphila]|uniref:MFS transporter n=1 Tax=Paraburkholderia oxyphila TaxID=614212 RepID=UPI001C3F2DD2|nr:MFS transporter [Paraburkholderia oxyphila]